MKIDQLKHLYDQSGIINQFGVDMNEIPEDVKDFAYKLIRILQNPKFQLRDIRRFVLFLDVPVLGSLYGVSKIFTSALPSNYRELHTLFEIGFNSAFLTPILFYTYIVLNELKRKERELIYDLLEKVLDSDLTEREMDQIRSLANRSGKSINISKRIVREALYSLREG